MTWKGFQKGIVRTPQNLLQKINKAPITKDLVYEDAERRFHSLEAQIRKLQADAKKYSDAIEKLLNHQIEYSKVLEELYKPISSAPSDPNAPVSSSNPEGIAACQQYRLLMEQLYESVKPDMEEVNLRISQPCEELLAIMDSVKKIMVKRDHKQLDLDRHTQSLRKAQDKQERSVKQEEKIFKVEQTYELALEEFNYFNDLLKVELPQLFALEGTFLRSLFYSFYYMQLNLVYTMQQHLEQMKIPYFDLEGDIVEKFLIKRGNVQDQTENLWITQSTKVAKPLSMMNSRGGFKAALHQRPGPKQIVPLANSEEPWNPSNPPQYTEAISADRYQREKQEYITSAVPNTARRVPAPPADEVEYCTALYDFDAQSPGDLSIKVGDKIEVLNRTDDPEGWWRGRLNGKKGNFPSTYVKLD